MNLKENFLRIVLFTRTDAFYFRYCFFISAMLFVITLIRAGTTGITYDEAYTYIYYAQSLSGFLLIDLPNNHQLNSLLIYVLNLGLPGIRYSEFLIRLPSLSFYILYLVFAAKAGTLFKHRYMIFTLLVSNYFLNEFFGLGRGYGMAAALLLVSLYVYYKNPKNDQTINKTIYLLLMACFANYSLLVFTGFFVLYVALFHIRPVNILKYIHENYLHLFVQAVLFLAMLTIFLIVTGGGGTPVGSSSFFTAIPLSFAKYFTLDRIASRILALGFTGIFVAGIAALREKIIAKPALCVFLCSIFSTFLFSLFTHRPIPSERTILSLWPAMVFAMMEIVEYFELCIFRTPKQEFIFNGISFIVISLFMTNFFFSTHVDYTIFSKDDYPLRAMVYSAAINHEKVDDKYRNMVTLFYIMKLSEEFGTDVKFTK